MRLVQLSITAALALALAGTGTGQAKDKKDDSPAIKAARDFDQNPYPTTYRVYPGVPTALIGATVFDGAGGRIERGTVLLADGKVVGIGGPDLAVPDGYTRIDATGKFVTPGIIDIHSHLGVYPSPASRPLNSLRNSKTPIAILKEWGRASPKRD